jgi:hypothetical protein
MRGFLLLRPAMDCGEVPSTESADAHERSSGCGTGVPDWRTDAARWASKAPDVSTGLAQNTALP